MREWHGRTYTVLALEEGFEMAGLRFALPDGQLVDLGRQLLEAIAEEERILAPYYRLVRFTNPPHDEAGLEVLAKRQETLRR